VKLAWTGLALADREAIFDHIEADNPRAAIATDLEIGTQIASLRDFPYAGRSGRVMDTRELVINRTAYIAAYRVVDETVLVLRILHGARQWPDDMG
jgi:addiction module RelE/StbE family toxin